MQQKIKFNAWDVLQNYMWLHEDIIDNSDLNYGGAIFEKDKNFLPLEFVGVKDKNKKEKYVGDIEKAEDGTVGVIMKLGACFVVKYKTEFGERYYKISNLTGEIIGNIFENSELQDIL